MSGEFDTSDSKFKAQMSIVFEAQMSIVFEAQMSYRFTGKKAQTSCAQLTSITKKTITFSLFNQKVFFINWIISHGHLPENSL